MTSNGNVLLNNDSTIDSLRMTSGNALTIAGGSTLTVAAAPANGADSVGLEGGSSVTLGGTLLTAGRVRVDTGASLGLSGGTIMNATLAGSGTIQTNPGSTGTLRSVTISEGTTFAGQTGSTTTLAGTIVNNGTLQAAGGLINATTGFTTTTGTGAARIDPGGTIIIGANSTVGTLTQNGSLNLGANNITMSRDYTNANFGTGDSFDKHANLSTTGGQIQAAGPNTNAMQVITGAKVANGGTATPTLDIGILHKGDTTTFQIANQGTAANPSLRGAIQTGVNGGNITGGLLTGTGVTAGNFGPIAPGSATGAFEVTAAAPGILQGQAVHIANNFDNVREQTMAITGQVNNFAALAFVGARGPFERPLYSRFRSGGPGLATAGYARDAQRQPARRRAVHRSIDLGHDDDGGLRFRPHRLLGHRSGGRPCPERLRGGVRHQQCRRFLEDGDLFGRKHQR